ncbi:hypothetical protein IJH97_02310 [Candidatus Saccharibacteria bacterium]|nr:hypothetical protein [Candidatus Saccharibacteria bacterium]
MKFQLNKSHKLIIASIFVVIVAFLGLSLNSRTNNQTVDTAHHDELVKNDWHPVDDQGNTNGDVFDYRAYLEDHGATNAKVATYRVDEAPNLQIWQITWEKPWCGRDCTWTLYTENCDGVNNCRLECKVKNGQRFKTASQMGGEYVYDYYSAFCTAEPIYQEFRRVVENAEEVSDDCPLAACQGGHYVTDDNNDFAVWHDIGT